MTGRKHPLGFSAGARGFTLMEILVTIALIVVMALFLVPVFKNVQMRSKNARCISNLRQLHAPWAQYAMENDGYMLPGISVNKKGWDDELHHSNILINPNYGKGPVGAGLPSRLSVLHCPENQGRGGYWYNSNYGYNGSLGTVDSSNPLDWRPLYRKMSQITNPSKTVVLADGGIRDYIGGPNAYYAAYRTYYSIGSTAYVGYNYHGTHANFLFADGHVEALTVQDATERENKSLFFQP